MEILIILGLIKNCISQEFRFKNIHETRIYFIEKIKENELVIKKHKKVCKILSYI